METTRPKITTAIVAPEESAQAPNEEAISQGLLAGAYAFIAALEEKDDA